MSGAATVTGVGRLAGPTTDGQMRRPVSLCCGAPRRMENDSEADLILSMVQILDYRWRQMKVEQRM